MSFTPKSVAIALLFVALSFFSSYSQTPEQRQAIVATYDVNYLTQLGADFTQRSETQKAEATAFTKARNIPVKITFEDGGHAELQRILPDGTLIYYRTFNANAAISTRVDHVNIGGSTGFNLDGQNMIAHVWDGGHALPTHQEYGGPGGSNRYSIGDGSVSLDGHAAHVTGTIMASGVLAEAKGMAPQSFVVGYDWNNDLGEATTAAAGGMLISNHSYGYNPVGLPAWVFGAYNSEARDWDILMYNSPFYLPVIAAGNDGTENFNSSPLDPAFPQYDKLTGQSISKNAMVVANAQDANIDGNGNLISVSISSDSSQGPTDDFRIKPDITGNGTGVISTFTGIDTYAIASGTSMSSPNVAGSLLLLQQHYNNLYSTFMRAATLKGLALHTADDAGPTGPDAVWGWGLMNTKRAAETISENGASSIIEELNLAQGQTYTIQVEADGFNDLMASISWTDPAGTATTDLNNTTPRLVNDLDLRVTQGGTTYYPWRLTGVNTNANDGDNFRDPFERVDVTGASGTYTITVTHKGTLSGGSQNFSLIVTGILVECTLATVPENIQTTGVTATTASLNWNPIPGALFDLRYRKTGTTTWTPVEDIPSANTTLTGLNLLTEYEAQLRSKCPGDTPTAYSSSIFFTTGDYCEAGAIETDFEKIANVTFNTINNNSSSTAGYEDFTSISTPVSRGANYSFSATSPESYTTNQVIVWIDFNQNGDFSDPGEQVLITSPGGSPWTGNIAIPTNAELGETRMRIRLHDAEFGPNSTPCGNSQYGQVEDYTLVIYDDYVYHDNTWTPLNPSGVSTSSDHILVVDGETTLSGTTLANSLTIQQDAQLNIEGILNAQGNINNQGTLVFLSNGTTTGQLDTFTGTITGNVTVQRYIPPRRAFRLLSSPVSTTTPIRAHWQEGVNNTGINFPTDNLNPNPGFGTHITGSAIGENGFDATPSGNPSLFLLDNVNQSWFAIDNTDVNQLAAGRPYRLMVRGDRSINVTSNSAEPTATTLRATGVLATGTHTFSDFSPVAGHFNFFGNPYQAAVNINTVLNASANLNTNQYYVWDPNLNTRGAYVTVLLPAGTNTLGSQANQYLQPGQAAFVTTANNAAASITFQETHKAVSQPLTQVFNTSSKIDLRLYESNSFTAGGPVADGLGIRFSEDGDNGLTLKDAQKLFNIDENLAVISNDILLSIEHRANPIAGEILPLFINQYRHTDYVFEANLAELNNITALLRDNFTGNTTILENNENTFYAFSVSPDNPASIANDRFEIVFEELLSTSEASFGDGFVLFPNPTQDYFTIVTRGISGDELKVSITNVLGQTVSTGNHTVSANGHLTLDASGLKQGVYIVKLKHINGGQFTTKLTKK